MSESCAVTSRSTWALERKFSNVYPDWERPIALLSENSGASHGQKSRSTGQPKRDEAVGSVNKGRRLGGCASTARRQFSRKCARQVVSEVVPIRAAEACREVPTSGR